MAIPLLSEAQLLNKLRRAAEQGIGNAVEKRAEKEVENATERQMEKAFGNIFGPASDDPSGNNNFSKIMKGINLNVPTEASYSFTGLAEMEITGTDDKGKSIDPIKMKTFLNEDSQYSAMEFAASDQKQEGMEKTIMIFDMKNNASIILLENEGEKTRMTYGFDWQTIYDEADLPDSLLVDNQELNFKKSGNTKTIAGHLCEEYISETEEYEGSYWITKEPIEGIGSFWGKNSPFLSQKVKSKNQGYFENIPNGNILEFKQQSKTDKTTMQMSLVNIDESNARTFVMAEYPNILNGEDVGDR